MPHSTAQHFPVPPLHNKQLQCHPSCGGDTASPEVGTALPTPHTAPQHQCATRRRQMKTDHRDGGLGKITSHVVAICCLKPCWQSGLLPTASWPILACQRKEKPSSLSLPATRDLQLNTSSGQSAVEGCKEHQGLKHLFCGGRALGQLSMEVPVTTLWCPVIL